MMNLVAGQQLHTQTFLSATKPQRERLYSDVIDVLAQLRMLEFPTGGSLVPSANGEPILGPFLSMTANEFERNSGTRLRPETFASVTGFVEYHCGILTETYKLPVERQSPRDAKLEVFALINLRKEIRKYMDSVPLDLPFVLAHPDLRFGNMFIDDDFNIVGIIDWEFASTIPLQLFSPPSWITGTDPGTLHAMRGLLRGPSPGEILAEFRQVLRKGCDASSGSAKLWHEWKSQQEALERDESLVQNPAVIATILRHPSDLMAVYYSSIFRKVFGPTAKRDDEICKFFDQVDDGSLAEQVALQIEKSKRYTQYLESKGLLVDDVRRRQIQEYLAKTKHLV